jgi:thiol-disulfide isomerase/thioredoxin
MRSALLALLLAALLVPLAACNEDDLPGRADIDVDTPALRHQKQEAGLPDCTPGQAERASGDDALPGVFLPCLGGGHGVELSSLRGPMVINLWASWCAPCRRELPVLEDFHERYGDRVALAGVDWNDPHPAAALQLAADSGVTYPLLADPQDDLSGAGAFPIIRGLPQSVLVDADGSIAYVAVTEIKSVSQLVDLVEKHLGVTL